MDNLFVGDPLGSIMDSMTKQKRQLHIGHLLVLGTILIGTGTLMTHSVDASAEWRCNQLQGQANAFELFTITDTEKDMCASIGKEIRLQVDPEVQTARDEELASAGSTEPRLIIPENGDTPTWYKAQQYAVEKDRAYLKLAPKLKRICACESAGNPDAVPQQYEADGVTVLRGRVTPNDIGLCQISLDYWGDEAEQLGLDLFDPHDNVAMANHIFDEMGARPWYPSKKCHGYEY